MHPNQVKSVVSLEVSLLIRIHPFKKKTTSLKLTTKRAWQSISCLFLILSFWKLEVGPIFRWQNLLLYLVVRSGISNKVHQFLNNRLPLPLPETFSASFIPENPIDVFCVSRTFVHHGTNPLTFHLIKPVCFIGILIYVDLLKSPLKCVEKNRRKQRPKMDGSLQDNPASLSQLFQGEQNIHGFQSGSNGIKYQVNHEILCWV